MHEEYVKELFNGCVVARPMGIHIDEVREGYARGRLLAGQQHRNPFGSVHGGIIFSLADHVGGACGNTLGKKAVLVESTIQYARAAFPGDDLVAEAQLTHRGRKIGRIDIRVRRQSGEEIAFMHMLFFVTGDEHRSKAPRDL